MAWECSSLGTYSVTAGTVDPSVTWTSVVSVSVSGASTSYINDTGATGTISGVLPYCTKWSLVSSSTATAADFALLGIDSASVAVTFSWAFSVILGFWALGYAVGAVKRALHQV